MRSLTRAVVVGALTLPLALAGVGMASAGVPQHHEHHHLLFWVWDIDTINAGVINNNSNNGVGGSVR